MNTKKKIISFILMMLLISSLSLVAGAASLKVTTSGVTAPSSIKKGGYFVVKGTVKANSKLKEVRVMVYNPVTKKYPLKYYFKNVNASSCNLAPADAAMTFNQLPVGTYYYQVYCIGSNNAKKLAVNKKFLVTGTGKIKIVNPRPSANIALTMGSYYSLSGTIQSAYKLNAVKAVLTTSAGKTVYSASVRPNKTTYNLSNSPLDIKMAFNELPVGSYKLKVSATDVQGTSANVIYRTITIKKNNSTTPGAIGGSENTDNTYLNTTDPVTVPAGFTPRVNRPPASSKYYYNKNYNIYYKYNNLAPTGKSSGEGYVIGNCTWYACGRAMEIVAKAGGNISKVQAIFGGDPVGIYNANVALKKFKYGKKPKVGALAIFNYGADGNAHIAVVEKIVNGVPWVSESGYSIGAKPNAAKSNIIFKYQSIYNWAGGRSLRGYIYLL